MHGEVRGLVRFYVQRTGEVWQLNDDLAGRKTWHAGHSAYQGFNGLNEGSYWIPRR